MDTERLEVGALLQRTWHTISAAPTAVITFFVAMSAVGSAVDISTQESGGGYLLNGIVTFVAGYFLLRALLRSAGLLSRGASGGFGVYFGASFLSGLGMLAGFVLLLVPGLILMVRWSAAFALVVSEDESAGNALGESWAMTRGNFWPIFAAMLVGLVPLLAIVIGFSASLVFADEAYEEVPPLAAELIAANVVGTAYSVFSAALGVAVYGMLRGDRRDISEVFA